MRHQKQKKKFLSVILYTDVFEYLFHNSTAFQQQHFTLLLFVHVPKYQYTLHFKCSPSVTLHGRNTKQIMQPIPRGNYVYIFFNDQQFYSFKHSAKMSKMENMLPRNIKSQPGQQACFLGKTVAN